MKESKEGPYGHLTSRQNYNIHNIAELYKASKIIVIIGIYSTLSTNKTCLVGKNEV